MNCPLLIPKNVSHVKQDVSTRDNQITCGRTRQRHSRPRAKKLIVNAQLENHSDFETKLCRRNVLLGGVLGASGSEIALAASPQESVDIQTAPKLVPVQLSVLGLKNSIPENWNREFQQLVGRANRVKIKKVKNLNDIFKALKGEDAKKYDLVSLGDAWLEAAIQNQYIVPFGNAQNYRWWENLPARWRSIVVRDGMGQTNKKGAVFAVPYRWGCTVVAYREDKFKKVGLPPPQDWQDLLHPKLHRRIAFVDSPREFLGVALKSLGLSFNAKAADLKAKGVSEGALKERLAEWKRQVLVFSNSEHVRALASDDAWVAVGSSLDVLPMAGLVSSLRFITPYSGTALWSDHFVIPAKKTTPDTLGPSPLINAWADFILSPARSNVGSGMKQGLSPLDLDVESSVNASCEPKTVEVDSRGRFLPPACVLGRSEFLLPLGRDSTEMYRRLLKGL